MSAMSKLERTVYLIGGGEDILSLPQETAMLNANLPSQWSASLSSLVTFGFKKTDSYSPYGASKDLAASKGAREAFASAVLHLFPAFMTGKYAVVGELNAPQRAAAGAAGLVARCEKIVAGNVSLAAFVTGAAGNTKLPFQQ